MSQLPPCPFWPAADVEGHKLSDDELGVVAGGVGSLNSQDSQQSLAQAAQFISNMMNQQHDTTMSIIGNLRA